ncbi:MAG: NYN domain-containing protein [Propionibacteriales bacterium]|nr:NYN domain-containing protein [Propionibacteriales bacterium]
MPSTTAETMVFVDAGYVFGVMKTYHQLERLGDLTIDYQGLVDLIRNRIEAEVGPILRIRWYDAVDPTLRVTNPRALAVARLEGVRLVPGRIVNRRGLLEQKAVDTRLVVDMTKVAFGHQVPHMVLISGDEDMIPGVEAAQDLGLQVEIWSIQGEDLASSVSRELNALADRHRSFSVTEVAEVIRKQPGATHLPPPIRPTPEAVTSAPGAPPVDGAAIDGRAERPAVDHHPGPVPIAPSLPTPPKPRPTAPRPATPPGATPATVRSPAASSSDAAIPPTDDASLVDLAGLYGIDQAAYHRPIEWGAAVNELQRAVRAGSVYAERWWAAADQVAKDHLGELCPGPQQFIPIPRQVDADLLSFAEDQGIDTWGPPSIKMAVRTGFWDEIDAVAPASSETDT